MLLAVERIPVVERTTSGPAVEGDGVEHESRAAPTTSSTTHGLQTLQHLTRLPATIDEAEQPQSKEQRWHYIAVTNVGMSVGTMTCGKCDKALVHDAHYQRRWHQGICFEVPRRAR